MKSFYLLSILFIVGLVFVQESSGKKTNFFHLINFFAGCYKNLYFEGWFRWIHDRCGMNRVARCQMCTPTCESMNANANSTCIEPNFCEVRCVCRWPRLENQFGQCVHPSNCNISKHFQHESAEASEDLIPIESFDETTIATIMLDIVTTDGTEVSTVAPLIVLESIQNDANNNLIEPPTTNDK